LPISPSCVNYAKHKPLAQKPMNSQTWKTITAIAATIAAGIPLWTASYRDIQFLDPTFIAIWLALGIAVVLTITLMTNISRNAIVSATVTGFFIALAIRITMDAITGNPVLNFALGAVVSIGCGLVSGFVGVLLGNLIKPSKKKTA